MKQIAVAIRKSDSVGWMIEHSPSDPKHEDRIHKIAAWSSGNHAYNKSKEIEKAKTEINIFDNTMITGFEVSDSFQRGSYYGTGNVIWRIKDPRGFELELYSEAFAKLLTEVEMVNGKITTLCMWSINGTRNVLIPENSEVYKDYEKSVKIQHKPSLTLAEVKAIKPYTKVIMRVKDKLTEIILVGETHYLDSSYDYEYNQYNTNIGETFRLNKCKKSFLFFELEYSHNHSKEVYRLNSKTKLDIVEILETKEQMSTRLLNTLKKSYDQYAHRYMFVSDFKLDPKKIKLVYKTEEFDDLVLFVKIGNHSFYISENYHSDEPRYRFSVRHTPFKVSSNGNYLLALRSDINIDWKTKENITLAANMNFRKGQTYEVLYAYSEQLDRYERVIV